MAEMKCSNCGKTIEVPNCCGGPMTAKENKLVCSNCGKSQELSNCCGKPMLVNQ